MKIKTVLGVETSCDETAVAIYDGDNGLLSHEVYSQTDVHQRYGGVVPELASRDHIRKLLPQIKLTLSRSGLSANEINGIAYTKGPGLIGALMVGASVARSLAWAWNIPCVGVHHMEAHIMAALLEQDAPEFPFLALIVSGGHTLFVKVDAFGSYELLGESLDDAVGEAFDKTAKLLGLPYPGGPELAKLAEQGNLNRFHFPRPMVNKPGLDFSFSGLKTCAMNCYREHAHDDQLRADIAAAFEDAVVDTMMIKSKRALNQTQLKRLVVVGGVSANKKLRARLRDEIEKEGSRVYYPRREFCTDNGAMVAFTGYERLTRGFIDDLKIQVKPRWSLSEI